MNSVFLYVVDRDFGFAPNPFHGYCTLATCKPKIRKRARPGDWVIGMGGSRLSATGHCIFAMQVTAKTVFNEYWNNPAFIDKRPIRNGSNRAMVGDNIYHFDPKRQVWHQADSHHSNADGSVNAHNRDNDTSSTSVLISQHFYYFGKAAPKIPAPLLSKIGFKNCRNHRRFGLTECSDLISWIESSFAVSYNRVMSDPFDFEHSHGRYDGSINKVF